MTTAEAKKDAARRLAEKGITYRKLTARTVSFAGFGYGECVFVKVWGKVEPKPMNLKMEVWADVPKPSDGGYCVEYE